LNLTNNELSLWRQDYITLYTFSNLTYQSYSNISELGINFEIPPYANANPVSPPISGDQALSLALQYGGWNFSSLQKGSILVEFGYTSFQPNQTEWIVNESYGPVSNFAPIQNGSITYRYVWAIQIFWPTHESDYLVDSYSGEIFPALGFSTAMALINGSFPYIPTAPDYTLHPFIFNKPS
jgi:hypothetical protein